MARQPFDAEMRAALGDAYPRFQELVAQAGEGAAQWRQGVPRQRKEIVWFRASRRSGTGPNYPFVL